jgi:hypothetical protein
LSQVNTPIDVWFDLIDLRNEGAWTVCGLAFGMLMAMGAVSAMVWSWSFRDVVILSPWQLWAGSAMSGSQRITFDDIGTLTIERDEKRKFWILRNASVARRAVRVPIEAYPALYQQIQDFRSRASDTTRLRAGDTARDK